MTSQYEKLAPAAPPSVTVRAAGHLRVVAVWQAFGEYAAQVQRTTVHCKRKTNLEEMTVTFRSTSLQDLSEITRRLNALSWVSAASLHVAASAAEQLNFGSTECQ
jgi:hypothetical protein